MTLQANSQGQSFMVLSKRQLWEQEHGHDHLPLSILHTLAVAVAAIARTKKRERGQEEGKVVPVFSAPQWSYLELRATLLQTSCYACFQTGLTMVSSLCNGLRVEEAGGTCQAILGRVCSGAAGWKVSSIHLADTAEKYEEGCRDLGEREQEGRNRSQSSSK